MRDKDSHHTQQTEGSFTYTTRGLTSANGVNTLRVAIWRPAGDVRAILQISHGMIEHIGRYTELAECLAQRGFLVVGGDHLGHGRSVRDAEELGYFAAAESLESDETVLRDLRRIHRLIRKEHPDVPYFLLGHSMGSFFARAYLQAYGSELDGVIVMGTGDVPYPALLLSQAGLRLYARLRGDRHRSRLLDALFHKMNNRGISHPRTSSDWLSHDAARVDDYIADPLCQYSFTLNGYLTLLAILLRMERLEEAARREYLRTHVERGLPVAFLSGGEDPVGNRGAAVRRIYRRYRRMGYPNAQIQLFPGDRHEILNELDREQVLHSIVHILEGWL